LIGLYDLAGYKSIKKKKKFCASHSISVLEMQIILFIVIF